MKRLILRTLIKSILIFNSLIIFGQSELEPSYYLNLKQININKVFFNITRIDSLNVIKNSLGGGVYFFSKNREFTYYRLPDILKLYTNIKEFNDSILFKINGEILQDTTSVKIDDTYFIYVETDKLSNVKYLSRELRNLTIVNIDLETKKREPEIRIRGNQGILDKFKNK
jgi:hypothetical protein